MHPERTRLLPIEHAFQSLAEAVILEASVAAERAQVSMPQVIGNALMMVYMASALDDPSDRDDIMDELRRPHIMGCDHPNFLDMALTYQSNLTLARDAAAEMIEKYKPLEREEWLAKLRMAAAQRRLAVIQGRAESSAEGGIQIARH